MATLFLSHSFLYNRVKMTILHIVIYSFIGFSLGYVMGRIGHCYINVWLGNPAILPHHWIYGALLIPISSYFTATYWGLLILFFGVGHFVSDLKDFLHLKFFSADEEASKRFFHID